MKYSVLLRSALCLAASTLLFVAKPVSAQIVNGGFESGTFSGWTVVDPSGFTRIGSDPAFANSGTYHANLGSFQTVGSLSQTFNTAAGSAYNLTFSLANDSSVSLNQFDVLWNGAVVFTLTNAPFAPYALITIPNLNATGPATTLEFRQRNDDDFFRLDDVSASVVPESSTISFTLLGFGILALVQFRKSKNRLSAASR